MSKTVAQMCRIVTDARPTTLDAKRFVGHVSSGLGRGAEFVSLPGYAAQFRTLLGTDPYPGTLNITLNEGTASRDSLDESSAICLDGWVDGNRSFGAVRCYPATVTAQRAGTEDDQSTRAYVVDPVETDHDSDTLELVASVQLRDALGLDDGDRVVVHVEVDSE